jgi:hypothetical protein
MRRFSTSHGWLPRRARNSARSKGMPRGILESRSADILAAVARGVAVPEIRSSTISERTALGARPRFRRHRVTPQERTRRGPQCDSTSTRACCRPRERLEAVARRRPKSVEELAEIPTCAAGRSSSWAKISCVPCAPRRRPQGSDRARPPVIRPEWAQIATSRPTSSRK